MSEKYSVQNFYSVVSPVRGTTLSQGRLESNKRTSKRSLANRSEARIPVEKKEELKNNRERVNEESPANGTQLNLTLVGSPAPRSQVRTLIASTSAGNAVKCKTKSLYGSSKSRELSAMHDVCMEKLHQFADNPTKFVRVEGNREETELKLDLAFSDRTDESDNYYNSHNIAFGENGEYRIPEYDHIRFLQFSIGDAPYSRETDSAEQHGDSCRTSAVSMNPENNDDKYDNGHMRDQTPEIDGHNAGTPISLQGDNRPNSSGSGEDLPGEVVAPWNPKINYGLNWTMSNVVQNHPLGSAINYKNTINPGVEKFMLDTEAESLGGGYIADTKNTLDKNLLAIDRDLPEEACLRTPLGSVENTSQTFASASPETGRTTLSQTSSGDGTWHGHSLNSPYFASLRESNCRRGNLEDNSPRLRPEIEWYEETDECLTIVKDECNSASSSVNGAVHGYTFIADQRMLGTKSEFKSESGRRNIAGIGQSSRYSSVMESAAVVKSTPKESVRMDLQLPSTKIEEPGDNVKDICEDDGAPDDLDDHIDIPKIPFTSTSSSSSSATSFSSPISASSSSSSSSSISGRSRVSSTVSVSAEIKTEGQEGQINIGESVDVKRSEPFNFCSSSNNVLHMTLDEVYLAAEYSRKLSKIFDQVLKRSESSDSATYKMRGEPT